MFNPFTNEGRPGRSVWGRHLAHGYLSDDISSPGIRTRIEKMTKSTAENKHLHILIFLLPFKMTDLTILTLTAVCTKVLTHILFVFQFVKFREYALKKQNVSC